jgi:hypothetical protein
LWSRRYGDADDQTVHAVAVHASGRVLLAGSHSSSLDVGEPALTATTGQLRPYLASLDASGGDGWAVDLDDAPIGRTLGVVDATGGDLAVVGFAQDGGFERGFVAKLAAGARGAPAVRVDLTGVGDLRARAIGVDTGGNMLVATSFEGTTDRIDPSIAESSHVSAGALDVVVAKLDPLGQYVWSRQLGANGDDVPLAVAVHAADDGNVVIAGEYRGAAEIAVGGALPDAGATSDLFGLCLRGDGEPLWVRGLVSADSSAETHGAAIALDANKNLYLAGRVAGAMHWNGDSSAAVTGAGQSDALVMKILADGTLDWAKAFGGSAAVAATADGAFAIGGAYSGGLVFGAPSEMLRPRGGLDAFVARFGR